MLLELIIFLFVLFVYYNYYVIEKITNDNEIMKFDGELTKQGLNNQIMYKIPTYLNGEHFLESDNIYDLYESYKLNKKKKDKHSTRYVPLEYTHPYHNYSILEPMIKSNVKTRLYNLSKDKYLPIHKNSTIRNFYIVHKGCVNIWCIHPKYSENFHNYYAELNDTTRVYTDINYTLLDNENTNHIDVKMKSLKKYIQQNESVFNHHKCNIGDIIYIPNKWHVYIENDEEYGESYLEHVQYSTPMNVCYNISDIFHKIYTSMNCGYN